MSEIKSRKEIDSKYKWKLEDIFASDEAWETAFSDVRARAKSFEDYKGRTTENAKTLLEVLTVLDEIGEDLLSVSVYASMRRDEDNLVSKYRALVERAGELESDVAGAVSFVEPEITACGKDRVLRYMDEEAGLKIYAHFFDNLFREAEHILTPYGEKLLALSGPVGDAAHDIFSAMNNADLQFDPVTDKEGKTHELTHGRYGTFLESADRTLRKSAYDSMYTQYKKYKNTFAATFASNVKSDLFYAKARGYESTMQMRLSGSFVPAGVYDGLIDEVTNGIPVLSEYLKLIKSRLGLPELCMYDLYTPIIPADDEFIPYEKACEMVLEAVKPLGEQYVSDMKRAFSEGWVDVYENRGKTPGAYSWGDNLHHPFVLLNYQGKTEDVFTLAHEMGHAMHSYYTNKTQPLTYRNYKIFVAEVASTVNENLLLEYLLKDATGDRRAYLLGRRLEAIRTTFYRQTMFAEFEKTSHAAYANGEALTAESLSEMYAALNEKYYGAVCACDENIAYEWARIPHFYTSFYVYQYATGFAAATAIKELVLKDSKNAEKYMSFLSSGDSDYPLEVLKRAGVDLTCGDAARAVVRDMKNAICEIEK
ncbi:MAG: oligoendopeptidase F [Oscillospiraceae bacterium]|nr:oligoendopeptidase F [Oscillospiraceae bacterium]